MLLGENLLTSVSLAGLNGPSSGSQQSSSVFEHSKEESALVIRVRREQGCESLDIRIRAEFGKFVNEKAEHRLVENFSDFF